MTTKPLTAEEMAWVEANANHVRALMGRKSKPQQDAAPDDPVERAAWYLIKSIKEKISRIEDKYDRDKEKLNRYERMAEADAPLDDYYKKLLVEERPIIQAQFEKYRLHIEALKDKLFTLETEPESHFLPIGTVVKFTGVPEYEDSLALSDERKSYPVPGSVGVVTGLRCQGEQALWVSMRRPFKDGWKSSCTPTEDRMATYRVDREMLEVVSFGKLPDGTDHKGYGWIPTHFGGLGDDSEDELEMILEADGYYWRFHDFGGTQGIEALHAADDMSCYSWVKGTTEEFCNTAAPKV